MSVLLFWGAFVETPKPIDQKSKQNQNQVENNLNVNNNITPNINEPIEIKTITIKTNPR